jgi:PKD domain
MGRSPSAGATTCRWRRSTTTALASLVALTTLLLLAPTAWASGAIPDSGYVTNGEVKAITHSGSITYIGGTFTEVGPATGPGVGINESTGADLGWARIWGGGGSISAVVSDGSGGYYIGGSFTEVAGHPAENLAHIKSGGEVDTGWLPKANGEVKALAVSGEIVYVGGSFTVIGTNNASRNRVAALKASSVAGEGEATTWNPNATAGVVNALVVSGEVVYVGGTFTVIGTNSQTRNRIAAIKTNATATATAEATTWNPNASAEVKTLAVSGEVVYVGGTFTTIGSTPETRNRLAAIKTNATATVAAEATTWNPNATAGAVNALVVSGEVVYVGGTFTVIGTNSQTRNRIAAIKTNATAEAAAEATTWNPNANAEVTTLAVSGTSTVYVGGTFTVIGTNSQTRHRIAAIKTNATATAAAEATTWNPNANATVKALAISGSTVYAGGTFASIGATVRNRLAALNASNVPTSWNPNATAGEVKTLAVSGEVVYVGGTFTVIGTNSQTRNRLAAIKTNATAEATAEATTWNPNATAGAVNALVVSGEIVYAGGTFTVIGTNSQTRNRIAAIKTNATATATAEATTWNPNANAAVLVVAVSGSGSRLYIGGAFTSLGTGDRSGYASFTFGGPAALFSVSAGPYTAGVTTVTFTNESTDATSSITSYEWTFGDSGTAASASPTHEYSAPCSPCTITLKVTDAEGLSAEVSHTITVAEGTLTFFTTLPTLPVLPGVTLNGETQTTTTTMNNFTVDDARSGAGAGWNVTVASLATVGTTVSETFKEYCNSVSPCGGNAAERYVSGGRELPANSLTLKKTTASFSALPGGTGSAPALECASECHVYHSTPEKVAGAAAGGAGKGGWQTTGFSGASLSLATPMNLYVLANANEVYRVDIVWTLNSGP